MAASTGDKITDVRNAARPNSARATGTRTAGGISLACDNLSGWPTASKVHFVTYQINSSSAQVAGTQLDCEGIVSGNTIGSIVVNDGTDTGNSVNDVVEMIPTAKWGQDLADALTSQHSRTGTHTAITATSLATTGNSSIGGNETITGNLAVTGTTTLTGATTITALSNPYKFSAYRNAAVSSSNSVLTLVFDVKTFDTGSNYSTSTGRFTAPVAGFYFFDAAVSVNFGGNMFVDINFLKNNSSTVASYQGLQTGGTQGNQSQQLSKLIPLAANDTIEFTWNAGSIGGLNTGAQNSWFEGFLISAT